MIDKTELKNALKSLEADVLSQHQREYEEFLANASHDETEAQDSGEAAEESMSADRAQTLELSVARDEEALRKIDGIDFAPTEQIREGSIVCLDGQWFVVAVSTGSFKVGRTKLMGISADAPLFAAMKGKKAGQQVKFNGRSMKIEAVG
ncbi:hypothetical protein BH09PSE6_BH09PSE6_10460 [soil metagenome]